MVDEQEGVQEMEDMPAETPEGTPERSRVTDLWVPDPAVRVTEPVLLEPKFTITVPLFERE